MPSPLLASPGRTGAPPQVTPKLRRTTICSILASSLALSGCGTDTIYAHLPADGTGPTTGTGTGGTSNGGGVGAGAGAHPNGGATNTGGDASSGGGTLSAGGSLTHAGGSADGTGGATGTPLAGYPNGLSPRTLSLEDARAAYDAWKEVHLEDCGSGVYRVRWENARLDATVSEGIGYGMLLTVMWDEKEAFDGLYEYYKLARNDRGLMHWLRYGCDAHREETYNGYPDDAAADADLDVAMALIMAECKWGDEKYATEAGNVIRPIREHMFVDHEGKHLLIPGDSSFYHGLGGGCVNYSYFAPAYYREYAAYDPGNEDFWHQAADHTYDFLTAGSHSTTGLVRNWGSADGTNRADSCSSFRDDYNPDVYGDDAARTPWRVIVDYLWNGTPAAKAWTDKVTAWVESIGIESTVQWYNLDGSPDMGPTGWDDHTVINVGPFAAGAMSYDQQTLDRFTSEALAIASGPDAHDGEYFPRMLKALTLATLAGKFTVCAGAPASSPQ